jgi:copper chaperone NosL
MNDETNGPRRGAKHPPQPSSGDPPAGAGSATTTAVRFAPVVLCLLAGGLLLVSLKLPLWQMRLEAPQYRDQEALQIAVHPNSYRGDLRELSVLNQYIGVHVPPTLPQFKWLPLILIAGAAFGLASSFLPGPARRRALTLVSGGLATALALAAVQALSQMHDIGHKRDQKTVLAGVKDFTPPFLGTNRIAQFTVSSRFGPGAWLIGGALALQLGAAWLGRPRRQISLAPGFSPVEQLEHDPAALAAFPDDEAVETASHRFRADDTGLKSGVNEREVVACSPRQTLLP